MDRPDSSSKNPQTWKETNKSRKAEKRKWKEQNIEKKLKKQQKQAADTTASSNQNPNEEIAPNVDEISTISIAIPGSILENAQSPELRTYLAGQIARAACVFQVDEIVVFDDYSDEANARNSTIEDDYGLKTMRECCAQMGRILQYLECPQYLRKHFFPIHHHLKYCGIVNPLNAPHHLTKNQHFTFREGVVLNKPIKQGKGSIVNVGLLKDVYVDKLLVPGLRCTVKILPNQENSKKLKGLVVSPHSPRMETGIYWGYTVRLAGSLSKVFSQCPYKDGYDLTVGTSDKGTSVDEFECLSYRHLLIVFGGLRGIEVALESDPILQENDPSLLFDHYLNTLPHQGSKTIRTEEAVLISLSALRHRLKPLKKAVAFDQCTIKTNAPVLGARSGGDSVQTIAADDLGRFD